MCSFCYIQLCCRFLFYRCIPPFAKRHQYRWHTDILGRWRKSRYPQRKTVCQELNAKGQPSVPQAVEAKASKICVPCRLSIYPDVLPGDIATASLPTHDCCIILFFFNVKISCYILVKVLVHKGKLQVVYKSATCNLSLWIKVGTEHACLKASEFLDVHASLSPFLSFICSKTVLLHCTAKPHTFAKRHKVSRHTDTLN